MERIRRYYERIMPQSAFGVTLLTIAVMILIVGFFIKGIDLVSVQGELPEGYVRMPHHNPQQPPEAIRPGRGDPLPAGLGRKANSPLAQPSGALVNPSGRYATNRGTASSGYIASLTRTCDCRWAENAETPSEGTQFRVGETLNVAAGLVEIAFACGAKAVLEGPAVLELQSAKSGALRVGRMTADVPDEVEGFTVQTPVAQLVSLSALEASSVARIAATADCRWAEGSAVTKEGARIQPGQTVKLAEGLAEVAFASGAKVILQGPANLEIESAKTAKLHSGKITADVPDDLEGFKIRTSVAEILSLPAESKTPANKSPETKDAKATKASSVESSAPAPKPVTLKAGESAKIEAPAKKAADAPAKVETPVKKADVPAKVEMPVKK